ncbi:MAG TPA: hypothetical protein VNZ86_19545, partial [Bacteroidia bacterium]|nr:hypothetical protein [Bacteroidia bacterium]
IVPVNFQLEGPTQLCQGVTATYATVVKDPALSTIYTWTVKKGAIIGTSHGYNLNTINVIWSSTSTDTVGFVYLTTYNELLRCGRTDSIKVKLRPKFSIAGNAIACAGQNSSCYTNVYTSTYNWTLSGGGTINNPAYGSISWGTTPGVYQVYAQDMDNKTCNATDTFNVEVVAKPTILSVQGVTEILPNTSQTYTAVSDIAAGIPVYYSCGVSSGSSVVSSSGNTATINWGTTEPYSLSVSVAREDGYCYSDYYHVNITKDFVYTISGPDTVCISSSGSFTANTDPAYPGVYTWTSAFTQTESSDNTYNVTFDVPGTQSINLKVIRNGKEYDVFKNVYVKAAQTDIAITGNL